MRRQASSFRPVGVSIDVRYLKCTDFCVRTERVKVLFGNLRINKRSPHVKLTFTCVYRICTVAWCSKARHQKCILRSNCCFPNLIQKVFCRFNGFVRKLTPVKRPVITRDDASIPVGTEHNNVGVIWVASTILRDRCWFIKLRILPRCTSITYRPVYRRGPLLYPLKATWPSLTIHQRLLKPYVFPVVVVWP